MTTTTTPDLTEWTVLHESSRGTDEPTGDIYLERTYRRGDTVVRVHVEFSNVIAPAKNRAEVWTPNGWAEVTRMFGADPVIKAFGLSKPRREVAKTQIGVEQVARMLLTRAVQVLA